MRQLVRLAVAEALLVSVIGSVVGVVLAAAISARTFGGSTFGTSTSSAVWWSVASVATGFVVALLAIARPAWRDAKQLTVVAARRTVGRRTDPRWMRWGIDLLLLAGSALVFWITGRGGYKLVLAVEGVPTISVNYWAFLGPALAWLGGGLLAYRLAITALRLGRRPLRSLMRPFVGGLSGTIAASMSRQRMLLGRGLTLVALSVVFAGSTSVFNSTYQVQAEVDAVLSNGAMVSMVQSPGHDVPPSFATKLSAVAGVRSVTSVQHRYAYVGADLQDLYGVDPTTIIKGTKLRDSYFQGGTAKQLMTRLAAQPDAVLVSLETVKDFQLVPGDALKLRLQNGRTKQFQSVSFTYVGVVNEFPSAPSDSFLVANAAYVAKATGSDAVGSFLLDTAHDDSSAVARRVEKLVGTDATVNDVASKRRKIGTSLTSVELSGLTRVELGFALVLAAAASGLVLWLGLAERKRTFAVAAALGATPGQLSGFIWSESIFVAVGGLLVGALSGTVLTQMLVKVLTGVFDPPPSGLSIPWGYLGLTGAIVVVAVLCATTFIIAATRRPTTELLRDL